MGGSNSNSARLEQGLLNNNSSITKQPSRLKKGVKYFSLITHHAAIIANIMYAMTSAERYFFVTNNQVNKFDQTNATDTYQYNNGTANAIEQYNDNGKLMDPYGVIEYIAFFTIALNMLRSVADYYLARSEKNASIQGLNDALLKQIFQMDLKFDSKNIEKDIYPYMIFLKMKRILSDDYDKNKTVGEIFNDAKADLLKEINQTNNGNKQNKNKLLNEITKVNFENYKDDLTENLDNAKEYIEKYTTIFKFHLDREANVLALERLKNQSRNRGISSIDYSHFLFIVAYGMLQPFIRRTFPQISPLNSFLFFSYNVLVSTFEGAIYNKLFRNNQESKLHSGKLSIVSATQDAKLLLDQLSQYKGDKFIDTLNSDNSGNQLISFFKTFSKGDLTVWSMYVLSIVPDILSFYKIGLSPEITTKLTVILRCVPFFTSAALMTSSDYELKRCEKILNNIKTNENQNEKIDNPQQQSKLLALVFSLTSIPKQLLATTTAKLLKEDSPYHSMGDVMQIVAFIFGPLNIYLANNAQERVSNATHANIVEDANIINNFLTEYNDEKLNEISKILSDFKIGNSKIQQQV